MTLEKILTIKKSNYYFLLFSFAIFSFASIYFDGGMINLREFFYLQKNPVEALPHMPLAHAINYFLVEMVHSIFIAKLFYLTQGILCCILIIAFLDYQLKKKLLASRIIVLFNAYLIYNSPQLHPYLTLLFFFLITYFSLVKEKYLLFCFSTIMASMTTFTAIVPLGCLFVYILLSKRKKKWLLFIGTYSFLYSLLFIYVYFIYFKKWLNNTYQQEYLFPASFDYIFNPPLSYFGLISNSFALKFLLYFIVSLIFLKKLRSLQDPLINILVWIFFLLYQLLFATGILSGSAITPTNAIYSIYSLPTTFLMLVLAINTQKRLIIPLSILYLFINFSFLFNSKKIDFHKLIPILKNSVVYCVPQFYCPYLQSMSERLGVYSVTTLDEDRKKLYPDELLVQFHYYEFGYKMYNPLHIDQKTQEMLGFQKRDLMIFKNETNEIHRMIPSTSL